LTTSEFKNLRGRRIGAGAQRDGWREGKGRSGASRRVGMMMKSMYLDVAATGRDLREGSREGGREGGRREGG